MWVTTTAEGRERFGVTGRYPRELRSSPQHDDRGGDQTLSLIPALYALVKQWRLNKGLER